MPNTQFAPPRTQLPPFESFGLKPEPEVFELAQDSEALSSAYGASTLTGIFENGLVTVCAMVACIGGLLFGFDQGLLSITLVMPQFLEQFPEIDSAVSSGASFKKGMLTALLELGAVLGALQAGFLADKISRKCTIFYGLCWFILGSIIQTTSFSYAQLVVGRVIGGMGIGTLSTTAPMYISEIAPPHLRGSLLVLEDFTIVFGIVVMYYITYATRLIPSQWAFRLPFLVQIAPGLVLAVAVCYLPYSPRWLAHKGRDEDCLDTLARLRRLPRSDKRVVAEWLNVRAEACYTRESLVSKHPQNQGTDMLSQLKLEANSWADCFRAGVVRKTFVGILIMMFQQFSGINALIYYSPQLFSSLGMNYSMQLTLSGAMNVTQLVAAVPTLLALDRMGRRPFLIYGAVGMVACHTLVAAMIGKYSYDWASHTTEAWVGIAGVFAYMVAYGVGWGPIPWALPAEIHSLSSRSKGVSLSVCSSWGNNFIIGLITPPLIEASACGTFAFFGAFSAMAGVWAYFCVPETKGKSLEDMDSLFKSDVGTRDAEQKREILSILISGKTDLAGNHRSSIDKKKRTGSIEHIEHSGSFDSEASSF